jgi:hypothetical protein
MLYLATPEQLAALPIGTRHRVVAARPDLFGGCHVIECASVLSLPVAPAKYPNGVPILDAKVAVPWETVRSLDPLPNVTDAELVLAVKYRNLASAVAAAGKAVPLG